MQYANQVIDEITEILYRKHHLGLCNAADAHVARFKKLSDFFASNPEGTAAMMLVDSAFGQLLGIATDESAWNVVGVVALFKTPL